MKILSFKEYEDLKGKSRKKWLKYCFDICETYNWDSQKIAEIAAMYNYLTEITFINNGEKYAREYLKIEKFDSKNEDLVPRLDSENPSTLNGLTSTEDKEDRKEKNKIAKDQERILLIESLFKPVLKNKMTDKQLIRQISRSSYNRYLELLKKYSPDFYGKYIKKLEKEKQMNELMEKKLDIEIKNIYNHIVNGIETEEGLREFDMVDYYKLYGKYNNYLIEYIKNNCNKLSINEIKTLKSFHQTNVINDEVLSPKKINDFKETIIEFNCQKDQYGYLIPNSGITISREEKENMLKYLKDNKIPITNKTTRALINRYKASMLNKPKVKTRKPNN